MGSLVFPEYRQPDIIGAMMAAQQYRMREAELKRMQDAALAEQQAVLKARQIQPIQGAALRGSASAMERLTGVSPQAAMDTQEFLTKSRQNKLAVDEIQRKQTLRQMDRATTLLEQAKTNPALLPTVRKVLLPTGILPDTVLTDTSTADEVSSVIRDLDLAKTMLQEPEGKEKLNEVEFFMRKAGIDPVSPEGRQLWRDILENKYLAQKQPLANIYTGEVSKPTQGLTGKLQEDIVDANVSIATLENLISNYDESYQNLPGAVRSVLGNALSWVGVSVDKDFREKRETWKKEMAQFFQAYKKQITGASAAEKELDDILKASLSDSTPPDLVPATARLLIQMMRRNEEIKANVLRSGDVLYGTPEYWRKFDDGVKANRIAPGLGGSGVRVDAEAWGQDLLKQGVPRDEVIRRMREKFGQGSM